MTSGKSDLIDIEGEIRAETDDAILFDFGGEKPAWLPKSQIEFEPFGDGHTVTCPEWLALEKGMI